MVNKIILVGGYPATGKSTFADKLSEELHIPCFKKDIIKETLGDGFGSDSIEVFKKGSYTTFLLMFHITKCLLQSGQGCILESNFALSEIEEIKILLEEYNSKCLTFRFISDLDVMYERYSERHNAGKRHWIHKAAGDKEIFKRKMYDIYGLKGVEIGQMITVNVTSFHNVDYENLVRIAKRFQIDSY
jgi:predicted kinase